MVDLLLWFYSAKMRFVHVYLVLYFKTVVSCYGQYCKSTSLEQFRPILGSRITENPMSVWVSSSKNAHPNACIVRCTSLNGCVSVSVKKENNGITCEFFGKTPHSYENAASYISDTIWTTFAPPPVPDPCATSGRCGPGTCNRTSETTFSCICPSTHSGLFCEITCPYNNRNEWQKPTEWTGPQTPSVYLHFDSTLYCTLDHGAMHAASFLRKGIQLASNNHGYLDLGIWSGCWTAPATCANGMTLSMWIKLTGPPNNTDSAPWGGILSTLIVNPRPGGFLIEYKTAEPTATVYTVMEKDRGFYWGQAPLLTLDTWVHSVFVWDEGSTIYHDGVFVGGTSSLSTMITPTTDSTGKLIIGRSFDDVHNNYADMELDELLIFDEKILDTQVVELYNSY